MGDVRIVLDTNIVVAGLRSPNGASAALIEKALRREFVIVLSVALALEYEAACCEPQHRIASGLSEAQVRVVVTVLCSVAEPAVPWFLWRPQLRDPADEMVLETAINGRADALVTFNRKDYGQTPLRFGIELLSPQDALRRVRK